MNYTQFINSGAFIETALIAGVMSLRELQEIYNQQDFPTTKIISIIDPDLDENVRSFLPDSDNIIKVKFWDIEEQIGNYLPIQETEAKQIRDFIEKHKSERFLIHCMAGQSRSAGVAKAIECIINFGYGEDAVYNYKTSFTSEIDNHIRYSPNLAVFDIIVKR